MYIYKKIISDRANRKCKGSEAGVHLKYSRSNKEAYNGEGGRR